MASPVNSSSICTPSEDIVARLIEGDLIIIPLAAGIGDMEDELYSLNETGKAIWDRLDGNKSLAEIISELTAEYEAPENEIENDVIGITTELVRRKMLVVRSEA